MCVYMAKGISLAIVVAVADNGVIGAEGGLPWNISADLKTFLAEIHQAHSL